MLSKKVIKLQGRTIFRSQSGVRYLSNGKEATVNRALDGSMYPA
jgi:hypothetical protein